MNRLSVHAALLVCASFAVCGCGLLAPLERKYVFQPAKYPRGYWEPVQFNHEDVWFTAEDGTKLNGWFVPHPNPRAVVLFAHGNAGNVSHRASTLRDLHERHGVAVLCFDYRGYGKSGGAPSEAGLLQDARAARKWLAQRTGVSERDIVLMGRSLGGGVMVDLAATDGTRGLVLESTFTSVPDVARNVLPLLPVKWIMSTRFDSLSKIRQYRGPLLQSHGDADRLIPIRLAKRLFNAANDPKRFVLVRGGGHNAPRSEVFHAALDEFLDALPASPPGSPPAEVARLRR